MAALVAGPILYAQQKPIAATELQKDEIRKTEQTKTTQRTTIQSNTTQSRGSAINLSDTKAVNNRTSTKTEAKTTRIESKASSFKNANDN